MIEDFFLPLHNENDMSELVSVIMPTFNASTFLAQSIDSVLNQTYSNLELLITDDASTDPATIDILNNYARKDSRVKVVFLKENNGPGYARNKSIERACGRYIAFCDSDDCWVPAKLELQVAFMKEKQCCLSYSSYYLCNENNKNCGIFIAPKSLTFSGILRDNKIGCLTAIYDTEALGTKYLMPTIRKRQDWALFMNILHSCRVAYGITEPLAYYRVRPQSVSRNKIRLINYNARVYQEILGFSIFKSYCYLLFLFMPSYTAKVLKRKIDSCRYHYLHKRGAT